MIEIEMSKDIQDYEPKVVSVFSKRQIICLGIAAAYAVPLFFAMSGLEITTRATIAVLAAAPAIACGYVKLYGLPLEQFFIRCILKQMLVPMKRKYKTVNEYDYLLDEPETKEKKEPNRKEKKRLKDLDKMYGGMA